MIGRKLNKRYIIYIRRGDDMAEKKLRCINYIKIGDEDLINMEAFSPERQRELYQKLNEQSAETVVIRTS